MSASQPIGPQVYLNKSQVNILSQANSDLIDYQQMYRVGLNPYKRSYNPLWDSF